MICPLYLWDPESLNKAVFPRFIIIIIKNKRDRKIFSNLEALTR